MAKNWICNGFLIQDINDNSNSQTMNPYKGVGCCVSWPLYWRTNIYANQLTDEAENNWFGYFSNERYALAVVPSAEYIIRYLKICLSNNISTRVLYIESERMIPKYEGAYKNATFLGYDYATSQDFFSVLYDDLFGDAVPKELLSFKTVLNSYGLFNNEKDLENYVDVRNHLLKLGYDIEPHGDFCSMKISLIKDVGELVLKG